MIIAILSVLYFFVPAYIANMTPPLVRKLPFLAYPIDFGARLRGRPLLGKNKTWRGLILGSLAAEAAFLLQVWGHSQGFTWASLVDLTALPIWLGAAMGAVALLGDAFESAVKRQLGIPPGGRLLFWDQLDFLIAAALITIPYWRHAWLSVLVAFAAVFVLTLGVQRLAYVLGVKDDPL